MYAAFPPYEDTLSEIETNEVFQYSPKGCDSLVPKLRQNATASSLIAVMAVK